MERFYDFNTSNEPIELPPGFRFHPTDEELITHYLSPKVVDGSFSTTAVGEVDLNKVEPWDLPLKAKIGEEEWYFFCVRDRKYPTGSRTNRATDAGYWKATGKDKEIFREKILVGMKKTLVFYRGRAPRGEKTNWIMHEYRLEGKNPMLHKTAKNEWVVCRIFNKSPGGKKVHISGLVRDSNFHLDLPPLMDLSSDGDPSRAAAAAEGSHVTCFSNPTQDPRLTSVDEYSSSSNTKILDPNSNFSSQISSCTGNFHCTGSGLMQDQSMLRLLLQSNVSCIEQNAKAGFSQDVGTHADTSSAISINEVGFKPYSDDQQFPIISTGMADLDCLWNY